MANAALTWPNIYLSKWLNSLFKRTAQSQRRNNCCEVTAAELVKFLVPSCLILIFVKDNKTERQYEYWKT